MAPTLTSIGIACIIAAIVGGGLKAFEIEIPVLNSIRRQVLLAGFGCLLILLALMPASRPDGSSSSQATQGAVIPAPSLCIWDVSEPFTLMQTNGQNIAHLNLHQSGNEFTGDASFVDNSGQTVTGKAHGRIVGSIFEAEIEWSPSQVGVGIYTGEFDSNGNLRGQGHNKYNPEIKTDWSSPHSFKCK